MWDYPRPPRVEPSPEHVVLVLGGTVVAETTESLRVLETSHPPTYYLPRTSFLAGVLVPCDGSSYCEWKGQASYLDLVAPDGTRAQQAGWYYPNPSPGFRDLLDHVAVYPGRVDEATVAGERVRAQEGGFYGGWITSRVVGPFKGAPGTHGW